MLTLRNQYGAIDLAGIDPAAVADLSDSAQLALSKLIEANDAQLAARERHANAVRALDEAREEQANALEAHKLASDPFPYVKPDIENFSSRAAYDAACEETRAAHDLRVRAHRESEARKAAIRAYNESKTGVSHGR